MATLQMVVDAAAAKIGASQYVQALRSMIGEGASFQKATESLTARMKTLGESIATVSGIQKQETLVTRQLRDEKNLLAAEVKKLEKEQKDLAKTLGSGEEQVKRLASASLALKSRTIELTLVENKLANTESDRAKRTEILTAEQNMLAASVSKISAAMQGLDPYSKYHAKLTTELATKQAALAKATEQLGVTQANATKRTQVLTREQQVLQSQIAGLQTLMSTLNGKSAQSAEITARLTSRQKELADAIAALNEQKKRSYAADQQLNQLKQEYSQVSRTLADQSNTLRAQTGALTTGFRALGQSVAYTLRLFTGLTTIYATVSLFRQGVSATSEFSKTLAQLQAVTGATGAELEKLVSTARAYGSDTIYSARESSEGLLEIARAGYSVNDSILILDSTLSLASATGTDFAKSSEIMTESMQQFGLSASEANRVADVLVFTANSTATTISQLGEALSYTGAASDAFNVSIEETAAIIGILSNRGIQASVAGTNLRGIFTRLTGDSAKQQAVLHKLGLSLADINPEANDLVDIFELLHDRGLDATDAVDLFGRYNFQAALIIAGNVEAVRELMKAQIENQGVAAKSAEILDNSFYGSLKRLKNALEAVFLTLSGNGLGGGFASMINTLTDTVRVLFNVESQTRKTSIGVRILAESVRLMVLMWATWKISSLISGLFVVQGAFIGLTGAVQNLTIAMARNPIGIWAVALAAVASLAMGFTFAMDGASKAVKDYETLVDDLTDATERYRQSILGLNEAVKVQNYDNQVRQLEGMKSQLEDLSVILTDPLKFDPARFFNISELEQYVTTGAGREALERVRAAYLAQPIETRSRPIAGNQYFPESFSDAPIARTSEFLDILRAQIVGLDQEIINANTAAKDFMTVLERSAAQEAIQETIDDIVYERTLIGLTSDEIEIQNALREARQKIVAAEAPVFEDMLTNLERELRLNQELKNEQEVAAAAQKAREATQETARQSLNSMLVNLQREVTLLGFSADAREVEKAALEAETLARAAGIENITIYTDRVRSLITQQQELKRATQAAVDAEQERQRIEKENKDNLASSLLEMDEMNRALELEASLIGMTSDARERSEAAARFEAKATEIAALQMKLYGVATLDVAAATQEYLTKLEKLHDMEKLDAIAKSIGDSFSNAFLDIITGAEDASDALENLYKQVVRLILQQTIAEPISGFFGSLFKGLIPTPSYNGNVFNSGRIQPFANGGLLSSPGYFTMADGRPASFAERGPEAIMPLERGSDGKLGVRSSGGGGNRIVFNINTPDADSFRLAKRQILADYRKALRGR